MQPHFTLFPTHMCVGCVSSDWFYSSNRYGLCVFCECIKPYDQRFDKHAGPYLRTANSVKCDILLLNRKEGIEHRNASIIYSVVHLQSN